MNDELNKKLGEDGEGGEGGEEEDDEHSVVR